eukprot:2677555-Pleurochrysis_carterae.AAC.1
MLAPAPAPRSSVCPWPRSPLPELSLTCLFERHANAARNRRGRARLTRIMARDFEQYSYCVASRSTKLCYLLQSLSDASSDRSDYDRALDKCMMICGSYALRSGALGPLPLPRPSLSRLHPLTRSRVALSGL